MVMIWEKNWPCDDFVTKGVRLVMFASWRSSWKLLSIYVHFHMFAQSLKKKISSRTSFSKTCFKILSAWILLGKHIEELARRGSNPGMGSIQLFGTKPSHPQVLERQHPGNPVHQLEWERLFYGRAPSFLGVRDLSLKWFLIELESLKTHVAIPLQRQTPKDHRFRCQIRNLLPVTWTRWNGTPWGFFWAENAPVWNIQPTVNILSGSLVCELLSTACYRFFQRHSWIPSNPGRQDLIHWWGTFLWSKPALGKSLPQSNRTVEQNTHSVKQR